MTSENHLASDANVPCGRVLRVPVHVISLRDVVRQMDGWIQSGDGRRWIAVTSSHGIMEGFKHPEFKQILDSATLSVPDGKWAARTAAARLSLQPERVRGADLMLAFCALANERGYASYFLGDTDEALERLSSRLRKQFPGLRIAGAYSPPFRPLSAEENDEIIQRINDAKPRVLWVCLGLPKQERWIFANRRKLRVPIVVAAGAAAKFVSGDVATAPVWIREHGFEWLWRLVREPRRCWRRSVLYGPRFDLFTTLELSGVRRYKVVRHAIAGVEVELAAPDATEFRTLERCYGDELDFVKALEKKLRFGGVYYGVGCNVGQFLIPMAKIVGERGQAIGFEPHPVNHQRLMRNVLLNRLMNVRGFQVALGDGNGEIRIYGARGTATGVPRAAAWHGSLPAAGIQTMRGDDLRASTGLPFHKAVKIDVERAEFEVLCGLKETLSSPLCELLCLEIHPRLVPAEVSTEMVFSLVRSLGFSRAETRPRGSEIHLIAEKAPAQS